MFPIGHLALGYLSVSLIQRIRGQNLPNGWVLAVTALGSQLPDLIDKPLVYIGVLASGRSLGHSLLVMLPVLAIGYQLGRRAGYHEHLIACIVGVLSHYLGDTYRLALAGDWYSARFLLWPVFPAIDYPSDGVPPWIRVINSFGDPRFYFQYGLAALAFGIWLYDWYTRSRRNSTADSTG